MEPGLRARVERIEGDVTAEGFGLISLLIGDRQIGQGVRLKVDLVVLYILLLSSSWPYDNEYRVLHGGSFFGSGFGLFSLLAGQLQIGQWLGLSGLDTRFSFVFFLHNVCLLSFKVRCFRERLIALTC